MNTLARAIAFLLLGFLYAVPLILLAVAFTLAGKRAVFVHDALQADGAIIALNCPNQTKRHGYQCLPIFRFTAADRQTYMVESPTGGNASDFKIGDPVKVLYLKDNPQNARIDSFAHLWATPLIFAVLGALIGIFPLMITRARWRQRRSEADLLQH